MKKLGRFILKIGCIILILMEVPYVPIYCIFIYPFTRTNLYHYEFMLLPFAWLGRLNRMEKNYFYKLRVV